MRQGFVRIIGGKWRGRRLKVADAKGLRPTPDRVRETLFNWLMPYLPGARCLDLFAGTGALGVEALSRGASSVTLIDHAADTCQLLRASLKELDAAHAAVLCQKIPEGLAKPNQPFDIVFIDPPYADGVLFSTCHYLETHGFLAPRAFLYLEAASAPDAALLPANWHMMKSGKAGQVVYHLFERTLETEKV